MLVPLRRLLTRATLVREPERHRCGEEDLRRRRGAADRRFPAALPAVAARRRGRRLLLPAAAARPAQRRRLRNLTRELEYALIQAREANPDAIFLLAPWTATEAVKHSAEKFGTLPAELHLGPDRMLEEFGNAELLRLGPISTLQLTSAPLGTVQRLTKRLLDIVVAAAALIALAPLFAVVACLVKLDSRGPVFFRQRRYGYNQRTFRIVKFRTMRVMEDGAGRPAGHARRRPRDALRALAAALEHRRAAAALQCPQRRHVAGRPAPARAVAQPRIREEDQALCPAPQREAGHHRLGAGARLSRRDRRRAACASASSTTSTTSRTGRSGSTSRSWCAR